MLIFVAMGILIVALVGMIIALKYELQSEGVIGKRYDQSWRLYNDDPTYR